MVKFLNDVLFGIAVGIGLIIANNVLNFIASMLHSSGTFHGLQ
jgi:hypothetical protein